MARSASLDRSPWLPTYAWWPAADNYDVTVLLTPYHSAVEPGARFHFTLRGYAGANEPVWEHEVGELGLSDQRGVRLSDLDLPDAPKYTGGVLEVHGIRLDESPSWISYNAMWVDARGPAGGGYIIPTVPIRGQRKRVRRDDIQVIPGVLASREVATELVLLNVIDEPVEVRLIASNGAGLMVEAAPFEVAPWSAWRGDLTDAVPRARRLLSDTGGVGSLVIRTSHRLLPYFGFRRSDGPIVSMDHSAPIFA